MISESLHARFVRAAFGSAGVQMANRTFALVLGIILARSLGPDGYGIYAFAIAIMSLLMVVAEAGVPTLLVREIAANLGHGNWSLLSGALRAGVQFVAVVATSISLFGLLVLFQFADTMRPELFYTMLIMLILLPVSALRTTVTHAMRGMHRVVLGQIVDILIPSFFVLVVIALVFTIWPDLRRPYFAMAVQLFGAIVVLVAGALILRRIVPSEIRNVAPEYKKSTWLRSTLPFTLLGGVGVINSQTDIVMINLYMLPEDVGVYRVAVQGAVFTIFSLQIAGGIVAPHFSLLHSQNKMPQLQRLVTAVARMVFVVSVAVSILLIAFGDQLIHAIFGQSFAAAYLPLSILVLGYLMNLAFGPVGMLLRMCNGEKISAYVMLASAIVNVLLNVALIPQFGTIGAAVATASTVSGSHLFLWWFAKRKIGLDTSVFIRSKTGVRA